MKHGLTEETIKKIKNVFVQYGEVEEAILYGSRAKGNYRPGSDVDLTLRGKGLELAVLNKISSDIDDLLLPYLIDLSIYNHITNTDLISHIQRIGVSFYKREGQLEDKG